MDEHSLQIAGAKLAAQDLELDILNELTFRDAYYLGVGDLDAQRNWALCPDFKSLIKEKRDRVLWERNQLAQSLGLQYRQPHDYGVPRDYRIFFGHLQRKI